MTPKEWRLSRGFSEQEVANLLAAEFFKRGLPCKITSAHVRHYEKAVEPGAATGEAYQLISGGKVRFLDGAKND